MHDQEQYDKFVEAGTLDPKKIIITNQPKALPYQRNFALDMLAENEWGLFLCDDLVKIEEYENYDGAPLDKVDNPKFVSVKEDVFLNRCLESIWKAEEIGAHLIGFSHYTNAFFRTQKWKHTAKVDCNACLIKKSNLRYDVNFPRIGDWKFSIENLNTFHTILTNNWVYVEMEKWTPGGQGTKEQRKESRHEEIKRLLELYPDHVKLGPKSTEEFMTLRQIKYKVK